ncbi:hypothetical protein KSW81_005057 [Nannochloris sp. 'desiccata']|nr:hypothetical protein KSW81_005057 [Chlorella desiccata (nom. nud.)]
MAEGKTRLVRFWPCACWGSPSGINIREHQSEITRKIDLKIQATSSSTKTRRKKLLLHRNATPATTIRGSTTTTAAAATVSNKNLGHASRQFELGNSSEERGYIQAISPTPSSAHLTQGSSRHRQLETRTPSSPSSRAAASPFSPPAGCAAGIERENKHPKIRLRDSWDGLVVLHSPKTQQGEGEEQEEDTGGNNQTALDSNAVNQSRSPHLLTHNHYHHNSHNHNQSSHRSLDPTIQEDQDTTSTTTAIEINEADARLEGPLATPQSLLEEISRLVAVNDQRHVVSALVLLTQGVKHHKQQLDQCLEELLAVITACLQSKDDRVVSAALNAATELVMMYGDSLLQHMYAQQRKQEQQQHQQNNVFLLQLLICASRPSASPIKTTADTLLRRIASKMHQATIHLRF